MVSHVHTYAGQVEKANQAQDAALAAYPSGNFQGRSQIELHRATVFVRSGDIDAGMTHVTSMLERLAPWQREDGIVRRSVKLTLDVVPPIHRSRASVQQVEEVVNAGGRN